MEKSKQTLTQKFLSADDSSIAPNLLKGQIVNTELKTVFEEVVYKGLQKVVLGVTILFFIITIANLFTLPKVAIPVVVPISVLITLMCGALTFLVRKMTPSVNVANWIGGSLSILALVHALLVFYFLSEVGQTIGIILIVIASASLLVSLEWLIVVMLFAFVGWIFVMWLTNQTEWGRNIFLVGCSLGISYLVFITRMYALTRLETLNLKYQVRKNELEKVLEEKEKSNIQLEEALKKLKSSKEDLRVLINSVNGIVWESDANLSKFLFVSKKIEKILGYSSTRWLEEKGFWFSRVHPDDKEKVLLFINNEINYGRDYELEYRMITSDGNTVWVRDIVTVNFEKERVIKLQGVMFDITESKRVEMALMRSENRYRDLFEKANDIIYSHDLSGKFISVNDKAEELLGYSREEILQMNIGQILMPEQLEKVKERMKRRIAGEVFPSQELMLTSKNGHQIIFEVSSWLEWENGVPVAIHGISRDITERKRIEEALKESEERYKSLFNTAPIGIYRSTPDGLIVDANPTVIKMMGCSSLEELSKKNLDKEGADAGYSRETFKEILEKEGQIIGLESEWVSRKGEKCFIRENASVIKNAQGKILYYDGTIEDITERKEIENALSRNEKQYRLLFENNPCPCFVYEIETLKFLAANKVALERYGYSLDEIKNMTVKDIHPKEDIPLLMKSISGSDSDRQWRHCRKDGTIIDVEVSSDDAVFEGKKARLALANDVTERKQAEELLKIARDNALEAAQFKSQFLANMSHEIRTPLNGVIGMTYLLQDTSPTEKQKEYIEIIRNCGESLLNIVNDILDLAKIESGKLHFEQIDFELKTLIDDVIKIFRSKLESKNLNLYSFLDKDVPANLVGDPNRLRQVLVNLISNAIKFTERGGIKVQVKLIKSFGKEIQLCFEIEDSGIGMSSEVMEKLFQPFVQADNSTTRTYGGTGLGLAICKQLVEGMGGTIGVESFLNKGSKFWFEVCLNKKEHLSLEDMDKTFRALLQDLKVLLINDIVAESMVLKQITSLKMSSNCVKDGKSALDQLRDAVGQKDTYDLIIVEGNIVDIGIIDLIRIIRSDTKIANVKIMVVFSSISSFLEKEMESLGVSSLYKPVSQDQFYQCLRALLKPSLKKQIIEFSKQDMGITNINMAKTKILLVEDNPVNQTVAVNILNNLGCTVDVVDNGLKALGKLYVGTYDLIFMDCQMPTMDGYEATRNIRNEEIKNGKRRLPIIALTAGALPQDKNRCFEAGMDDYITKPFRPNDVEIILNKWLEKVLDPFDVSLMNVMTEKENDTNIISLDVTMLAQLSSISDDDSSFLDRILTIFVRTTDESLQKLSDCVVNSEIEIINKEAHRLKSSCSNVGAIKMANLCHSLEKAKEIVFCEELVKDLLCEYEVLKGEFESKLGYECTEK